MATFSWWFNHINPLWFIFFVLLVGVFGQSYGGRKDVVEASRHGCERGITKELLNIKEDNLRIMGNRAIARDPAQLATTKHARAVEAEKEEAIREQRYNFVSPVHGGTLVCSQVYPPARLIP